MEINEKDIKELVVRLKKEREEGLKEAKEFWDKWWNKEMKKEKERKEKEKQWK